MISGYLLKIARKVQNIILLFLVVLLLFAPVRAQAYYLSINPYAVTVTAVKPNWGDFIGKEGLRWYEKRVQKQRAEQAKIIKEHKINYDSAKKNFISKHNRLKRDKLLKELWDTYKQQQDKMTRKEQMELIKILDIVVGKDRRAFPFWGEYYNVNHEIQDKLLSLYDKESIKEIKELLDDPSKAEKYEIVLSWDDKIVLKGGFWLRYMDSQVDMDAEFHKMVGGSTYDRVRNYMKKELQEVKQHNQISPVLPSTPIAPGL
jgi:hypothetical protein